MSHYNWEKRWREGMTMIKEMLDEFHELMSDKFISKLPQDKYTHMSYPRLFHLMDFDVECYRIVGFGSAMAMHTTTKMGMELLTISLCPGEGCCLPYLLMDSMSMKKKCCSFVEYYGCGYDELNDAELRRVFRRFKELPDYEEKKGWYISEREDYSLIKSGEPDQLVLMVKESLEGYLGSVKGSHTDLLYRDHLEQFRERMIREGNPSSKTLNMLLGKEGAERFMRDIVMPIASDRVL